MSSCKGFLVAGLGFSVLLSGLVMAAETPPAGKENGTAPAVQEGGPAQAARDVKSSATGESLEQLIEQLDSAEFKDRENACEKLAAKGKAAIPALLKAAANGNLEVSSRATTILGKLLKSTDEATENAALKALENLADGDSPAVARKAKSLLENKNGLKNNAQGGIVMPGNGFGQIIINGGQLNIGGGAAMRTMSVKNVNGVKEITASEDGKNVKIQDDPAKGIKIELTEKENGKEVTKKYEAKNVEDLKKNHPAGYELYKKYGEQPGNGIAQMQFRIQAGGGNFLPVPGNPAPAIPLQPALPGPRAPANPAPQGNGSQLEVATRMVKNLSGRLDRLQKADACKDATPESKAELKKQIDELKKRLDDVRGQLGDK